VVGNPDTIQDRLGDFGVGVHESTCVMDQTRQTGSHERWNHPDGRAVTIPLQGGREIGPPLVFKILRQLGISLEEFGKIAITFPWKPGSER